MIQTRAYDVDGNSQVGYAIGLNSSSMHATLWHGSAASIVDLKPAGFSQSFAFGVDGNIQVGSGHVATTDQLHALLRQGTAASAVDLHPAGYLGSTVQGVLGNTQVGFGFLDGAIEHALVWSGTAGSYIDLQQFLPPSTPALVRSRAFGIAANGDIIGHVIDASGGVFAVKWSLIPEPSTLLLMISAILVLLIAAIRSPTIGSNERRRLASRFDTFPICVIRGGN